MASGERRCVLVAGLSVRQLAEACRDDGFEVITADCFGDADTRAAGRRWYPAGQTGALRLDPGRLIPLLATLAQEQAVEGWIAGSGFEAQVGLLAEGARRLPLWGNAAEIVDVVRDPRCFFAELDALGIDHPPVRFEPVHAADWLVKDFGGCGGWHIRPASARGSLGSRGYFQKRVGGEPMSVLFLAHGGGAVTLGLSRQLVRPLGRRPFVYRGCVGPVDVPAAVLGEIERIVAALAGRFGLTGINGLDFLLDAGRVRVLELNARPPASIAVQGAGLMRAHVRTCADGVLEAPPGHPAEAPTRGHEIVYARRALLLDADDCAAIAATGWCHDLPQPGTRLAWGDPLCSVSASGEDDVAVAGRLARQRKETWKLVEH
ncbi:MAG: ATP-grasp domain-containing protein [Rhodocyclaceae bacterium]|nr:ATP-grasp domain-containing protein [Rhodocyclaceae bacterium]